MKSISKEYSIRWLWWIGKIVAIEMPPFFGCPILASKVTCIPSICYSQSSLDVGNFVRTISPTFVGRIGFTLSHMHATEFHSDDFITNFFCALIQFFIPFFYKVIKRGLSNTICPTNFNANFSFYFKILTKCKKNSNFYIYTNLTRFW